MPLFSTDDLSGHLSGLGLEPVTTDAATAIERLVWGWLKPVLGLSERPNPVPDEVFSWAIELATIARENPTGLSYYQLGHEKMGYSVERRNEILTEASSGGRRPGNLSPTGSFPPASVWPDPAGVNWRTW